MTLKNSAWYLEVTTQPTVSCLLLNSFLILKILKNKEALVEMKSTIRFFFFFYIFSQNRRKNLSLNTDYILFFPRPVYMDGQERKLPSFILLIWTSWIQLILVSHEWGIFKHLSLTTENLQIQILCQTWLSSLPQMNLNSHMTQQYECHWPWCQWGTKCTAPCDKTPIKSRHCALFSI